MKDASRRKSFSSQLIDVVQDHLLEQVVKEPTRGANILDLLFMSNPSNLNRVEIMPGLSDHDGVFAEIDLQARAQREVKREIPRYGKANWDAMKAEMTEFAQTFEEDSKAQSVEEMWDSFKNKLSDSITRHVPVRLCGSKRGLPWVDAGLKRLLRKRDKLLAQSKKGHSQNASHLKNLKRKIQRETRTKYWEYIRGIVTPEEGGGNKRFWSYIKSLRQDSCGVAPLKYGGKLHTEPEAKANILNKQFKTSFTKEPEGELPTPAGPAYLSMSDISITINGVQKLLAGLNPHKAMGPDKLPPTVLRGLSIEIAPILTQIFRKALSSETTPSDWRQANVTPIFKKGQKYLASNYRPVSLTCVCCKLMEHIVVSSISRHLDIHNILHERQHGFRAKRSCETQLLTFMDELAKGMTQGTQTDVIIMDFSKAFDRVPHRRLLHKLSHYGVRGQTLGWIGSFLRGRQQRVLVSGTTSETVDVDSGVPQGSVLGPLLFLLYINDLPLSVESPMRLFADDCILYHKIQNSADINILQHDLELVAGWEKDWLMDLNPAKCSVVRFTRKRSPIIHQYTSHDIPLQTEDSTKYLGVTLTSSLSWTPHIENISGKANRTLGFIRRNLWRAPKKIKETAYNTMVRPQLEYCSSVWDPHTKSDIYQIERVQRRAARFVQHNYHNTSSVTTMLNNLGWESLEYRRHRQRLVFMYKIVHAEVAIPASQYLIPVTRALRGQHQYTFTRPITSKDYYKYSYFPRTIAQWNWLPAYIVQSPSSSSFSENLVEVPLTSFAY